MARAVLQVRLERLATDFLVQRATAAIEAPQVHSAPKETAILAPWVLLVCLDFQENLALREWASLDQRGILVFEGCLVYQDLRARASKDLRVTLGGQALQGQRGHKE